MRTLLSTSLRFRRAPLGPVVAGIALALLAALAHSQRFPADALPKTPAEKLLLARNPERLHLIVDATRVFGWISGTTSHLGETGKVEFNGRVQKIEVGQGNSFFWPYKVAKATRVNVTVAGLTKSIEVQPPSKLPPCVFFVVDRSVYRPQQTLRFAAFLRDLDARGEFVPRPAQTVKRENPEKWQDALDSRSFVRYKLLHAKKNTVLVTSDPYLSEDRTHVHAQNHPNQIRRLQRQAPSAKRQAPSAKR
jgi:hypothetical protein